MSNEYLLHNQSFWLDSGSTRQLAFFALFSFIPVGDGRTEFNFRVYYIFISNPPLTLVIFPLSVWYALGHQSFQPIIINNNEEAIIRRLGHLTLPDPKQIFREPIYHILESL
eukprot:scaffold4155_cov165-Amphora_coffeaeformis.AAC.9